MIDALILGKLYGSAKQGKSKNDSPYTTAKVRASSGADTLFVNVIAFADDVRQPLLALSDGDSVALTGSLTPKVWVDREGTARPALDMVATQVMTLYRLKKKREAVASTLPEAAEMPFLDDDLEGL